MVQTFCNNPHAGRIGRRHVGVLILAATGGAALTRRQRYPDFIGQAWTKAY